MGVIEVFCMQCGNQLPADSRFCNACGAPQGAGVATAVPQVVWEECEIIAKKNFASGEFVAEVFGPKGRYVADKIKCNIDLKNGWTNRSILDRFVARLVEQGWEAQPRTGHDWYSYRFRRPVQ
jgi:hypothetical protein